MFGGYGTIQDQEIGIKTPGYVSTIVLKLKLPVGNNSYASADCSKGTYFSNGICLMCPEQTYSDKVGSLNCTYCSNGFYGKYTYSSSKYFCIPTLETKFNETEPKTIVPKKLEPLTKVFEYR
jgi:hypothetical protein